MCEHHVLCYASVPHLYRHAMHACMQICAGYSFPERTGYITGTYSGPPLYWWLLKGGAST